VQVSWLSLKSKVDGFPDLDLKTDSCGLMIWPQNHRDGFLVWASNQVGYDLSVAPQNRWEQEDSVGHMSRSCGLLHLIASRAKVS
jgi:hypothetical protein